MREVGRVALALAMLALVLALALLPLPLPLALLLAFEGPPTHVGHVAQIPTSTGILPPLQTGPRHLA